MRQESATRAPDAAIAGIAARQHGVITAAQLTRVGLSTSGISRRVAAGGLHRIQRGVYAVGHRRLSNEGRWMAAVLACGEGAVLSHRSAAELWGVLRRARRASAAGGGAGSAAVDVTVPGYAGRAKRPGIDIHRSLTLGARHRTLRSGIPVTTPARTLDDLHRTLPPSEFAAVLREAEYLRLPVGSRFKPDGTRTELEARVLEICRRHRLPRPEVNTKVDRYVVDFLWVEWSLIVETDGWESHRTRTAFEEDRARDARLKLLGYEVIRFTWRQIDDDPGRVALTIRSLLRARSS